MNIPRIGGLAAAALMSAALLAGCGSSSDSAASSDAATSASTDAMLTTGVAKCDAASIGKAVQGAAEAAGTTATLPPGAFECADGWAYAFPDYGSGAEQVTVTLVFEAEGQFWIPKDRAKVCTAPGDEVPASIYKEACETN